MTLAILLTFALPALAVEAKDVDSDSKEENSLDVFDETSYIDSCTTTDLSDDEIMQNAIYQLQFDTSSSKMQDVVSYVLNRSEIIESMTIGDFDVSIYSTDFVSKLLYYCDNVEEVSLIDNFLYISYNTTDNKYVVMCYCASGLLDLCVYENESDTAICITRSGSLKYENVRHGQSISLSDELIDNIYSLIESGDIDVLQNTEGLQVIFDSDGNIAVEPDIAYFQEQVGGTVATRAQAPTTDAALLANLKADFPMYSAKVMSSSSKYCSYLSAYRSTYAAQDRTNYVKKSADWGSWAIGTAITVISIALGPPATVTIAILTAAGIGISTGQTILQAATLAKSAKYKFSLFVYEVVYDSTSYSKTVYPTYTSSTGEFTGGYNSSGDFTWVISDAGGTYNYSAIMDNAMANYDWHLRLYDGKCQLPQITLTY